MATATIETPKRGRKRWTEEDVRALPAHPAAAIFRPSGPKQFRDLADSIKNDGLQQAITLYRDAEIGVCILDGLQRRAACLEVGVIPRFHFYSGNDPYGYVRRANILRRHLSPSQRSAYAAKLMSAGQTQQDAALEADVSQAGISQASFVLRHDPDLLEDVIDGKVGLAAAYRKVRKAAKSEPDSPPITRPPMTSPLGQAVSCTLDLIGQRARPTSAGTRLSQECADVTTDDLRRVLAFYEAAVAARS